MAIPWYVCSPAVTSSPIPTATPTTTMQGYLRIDLTTDPTQCWHAVLIQWCVFILVPGLPAGTVAGIVIGVLAVVGVVILVAIFIIRIIVKFGKCEKGYWIMSSCLLLFCLSPCWQLLVLKCMLHVPVCHSHEENNSYLFYRVSLDEPKSSVPLSEQVGCS